MKSCDVSLFPERFRKLRQRISATQEEMAERIGVTRQSVSLYEKGERTPDIYVLSRIIDATGCSPYYLLGAQKSMIDDASDEAGLTETAINSLQKYRLYAKGTDLLFDTPEFWQLVEAISALIDGHDFRNMVTPAYIEGYFDYHCHLLLKTILAKAKNAGDKNLTTNDFRRISERIQEFHSQIERDMEVFSMSIQSKSCDGLEDLILEDGDRDLEESTSLQDKFDQFRTRLRNE